MEMVLPDENFSHVISGPEVDECLDHLLKQMAEDFDWSQSENKNENLKKHFNSYTSQKLKIDSDW